MYPYIRTLTPDCLLTRIDPPFGDMVWHGNGPDGGTLAVAVEYKQVEDVLACMNDGRFAGHQLPGLVEHYDRRYLLIEGRTRTDRNTGVLQKLRSERWCDIIRNGQPVMQRDLEHWVTTIEEQAQFRVAFTFDPYQSARWVVNKHSWWVTKQYEEHKSLKQFHVPPPPTMLLSKPGLCMRVVKELPDIQWERSGPVAAHFGTVFAAINATVEEWAGILVGRDKNGHRITVGPNRARKIWNAIRGISDAK